MKKCLTGAVDIGGTKVQIGIVDADGNVLADECFSTASVEHEPDCAVEKIIKILEKHCEKIHISLKDLRGIGISCAGPVDCEEGTIENPYTLGGWMGYPIVRKMEGKTGLQVRMENDANGALLGEVLRRQLQDRKVLMITFGTGIGAAFWNAGALYRSGKYHPEMGHVIVSSAGEICYCGHRGCFESRCSGKAMNERAQRSGYQDFEELYGSAEKDDEKARRIIDEIRQDLKNGVWTLNLIFKPEYIILAGGFARQHFSFVRDAILEDSVDKEDFLSCFDVLPAYENINSALAGANMLFNE